MNFSSIFSLKRKSPIASEQLQSPVRIASETLGQPSATTQPIGGKIEVPPITWFLATQSAWVHDDWHLRIMEKSRQVGATKTDAFDSVMRVAPAGARWDVWVTSRDELQARLYLEDCLEWARILNLAATDLGAVILDRKTNSSAHVLEFANGRRIYCLSSNPNALAGKRGHVKIDEFAVHTDQRLLYRIAKPVIQWGGTLSIISTHRGPNTLFNQIINDILHRGNPMGWHLYRYPIQKAVEEGIVERINEKTGRNETREQFLKRQRVECIDEEQWLQEYCCIPAEESSAFFSYDMINGCEDRSLKLMTLAELVQYCLEHPECVLYLGLDVARIRDLAVIDVGEKIGDVMWDRLRIELHNRPYGEIEENLYALLKLPQLKRACIDSGGIGNQLHERAKERFGYKAEGVKFTNQLKEELAFGLRRDFEDRKLRIVCDDNLRADLRAIRKEITSAGNIRIDGQIENSHCDRTWAKALRQHAARRRVSIYAAVA